MNLADLAELARRGMPPTHAQLLAMRNALPGASPDQVALAGQEHQAFAREWTQENPMLALPSLLFAIPGYSAAKAAGLIHSRTPASLDEMASAYRGMGEGISNLIDQNPQLRYLRDLLQGQ